MRRDANPWQLMSPSRRRFMAQAAAVSAAALLSADTLRARPASAPFSPSWESLRDYPTSEWYRDAKFGFMQLNHLWKAERRDPHELIRLYQAAGAKYLVALANHHDNFDALHEERRCCVVGGGLYYKNEYLNNAEIGRQLF